MAIKFATLKFKNDLDGYIFMIAVVAEEISFEDLRDSFKISLDEYFDKSGGLGKEPEPMSCKEAMKQGYRILALKKDLPPPEKKFAKEVITKIFYPEFVKRGQIMHGLDVRASAPVYFIPPSEHNNNCMDSINFEFVKAILNINKVFSVKKNGDSFYLHKKPWVKPLSQKWLMAYGGFRVIDFDLMSSAGILPNGDILPVTPHDKVLVEMIKNVGDETSFLKRFVARTIGGKER